MPPTSMPPSKQRHPHNGSGSSLNPAARIDVLLRWADLVHASPRRTRSARHRQHGSRPERGHRRRDSGATDDPVLGRPSRPDARRSDPGRARASVVHRTRTARSDRRHPSLERAARKLLQSRRTGTRLRQRSRRQAERVVAPVGTATGCTAHRGGRARRSRQRRSRSRCHRCCADRPSRRARHHLHRKCSNWASDRSIGSRHLQEGGSRDGWQVTQHRVRRR